MKRAICIAVALLLSSFPGVCDANIGLRTVVIDAGHGGHDPGAVSKDARTQEKTITLDVAMDLAGRIREAYPDVKVVMTRSKDVFVSLNDRADIANKAGADLFISIHVNAAPNIKANGYSVHMMGQSTKKNTDLYEYNLNVCRRENSVILLEDDYSTKYEGFDPNDPESYIFMQLMQSAHQEQSMKLAQAIKGKFKGGPITADRGIWQDPFYVLWKTAMPSVLVEIGFISNATDLEALRSKDNRSDIAGRLFDAFVEYKTSYDKSLDLPATAPAVSATSATPDAPAAGPQPKDEQVTVDSVRYGIQILAGSNLLPSRSREFMGYEPCVIKAGKIYRYIIAVYPDEQQTRADFDKVRSRYPDAFMVRIEGESTSRLK